VTWAFIEYRPDFFIRIFLSDPEFLADAVPALHLYFFAFIFQALQYSGQTVFKALGKKKHAIFFSLFRKVVMVVPLTYLLPRLGLDARGVFIAEPISNFVGGTACFTVMLLTVLPELRQMKKGS
jgi:Na+-driven multidrug efflux pump